MSETMNSGIRSPLTATGTFTTTQAKNTAVTITGNATNQTTTIGTVTAGKSWRVVSCAISFYHSSFAGGECYIAIDGVKILGVSGASGAGLYNNNSLAQQWDYANCPVGAATKAITLVSPSANAIATATLTYIEE